MSAAEAAASLGLGSGYEDIISALDDTRRVGDPTAELAVLKQLVRRLLSDVRTLASAQQRLGSPPRKMTEVRVGGWDG